jgi:hypothetical protein
VLKKLRNCSASEIRRSLPKKNKRPSTKQTKQSKEIEPDQSAEAEEISRGTVVRECLRAGLGMTMFLYGILAPSSMLTGFLIPIGSVLVFKAAQPFIRLGRNWFRAATAGENLLEVAVNLRKQGLSLARRAASGVGSALSRARLSELGKETVRFPGRIIGRVQSAIARHLEEQRRKEAAEEAARTELVSAFIRERAALEAKENGRAEAATDGAPLSPIPQSEPPSHGSSVDASGAERRTDSSQQSSQKSEERPPLNGHQVGEPTGVLSSHEGPREPGAPVNSG